MKVKATINRITDKPESTVKAYASVSFDGAFAVHGIKVCENILSQKEDLQKQVQAKEDSINDVIEESKTKLVSAIRRIETAYSNFDVRKLSAVTREIGRAHV